MSGKEMELISNQLQHLAPGVYVLPPLHHSSCGWKVALVFTFVLLILTGITLAGAVKENLELRETNHGAQLENQLLKYRVETQKDTITKLEEKLQYLSDHMEEVRSNPNIPGMPNWQSKSSWLDYATPVAIGVGANLLVSFFTGGLSLGGQVLIGVAGNVATHAAKAVL